MSTDVGGNPGIAPVISPASPPAPYEAGAVFSPEAPSMGTLTIDSAPGQGTTFVIRLPLA